MEYYYDAECDDEIMYCSVCGLSIDCPSAVGGTDCDIFCDVCVNDIHNYYNTVFEPVLEEVKKIKKVD